MSVHLMSSTESIPFSFKMFVAVIPDSLSLLMLLLVVFITSMKACPSPCPLPTSINYRINATDPCLI